MNQKIQEVAGAIEDLTRAVAESQQYAANHITLQSERLVSIAREAAADSPVITQLTDAMLTHSSKEVRQACAKGLAEFTSESRVNAAFQLESILEKLSNYPRCPLSGFYTVGADLDDSFKTLRTMVNDPVFVDRMIEYVTARTQMPCQSEVALVIRETPLPEKQEQIREMIQNQVSQPHDFLSERRMTYLPLALDASVSANARLLSRYLVLDFNPLIQDFRCAAIQSFGLTNKPDAEALRAVERIITKHAKYSTIEVAAATKLLSQHLSEETKARLLPLASDSTIQTAWIMAGNEGNSGLARVLRTIGLLHNNLRYIYNTNAVAALVLNNTAPAIAQPTLSSLLKGSSSATDAKCDAVYAVYAKYLLEQASTNRAAVA